MYTPANMKMHNPKEIYQFIAEFGFGVLVSGSLQGTHIPFLAATNEGAHGALYTHMAKANTHWRHLQGQEVMVIFSGPHSYISPTWYAKAPAVPTWNYAAVHAYGIVTVLDKSQTVDVVERTIEKYEPELFKKRDITTVEYTAKLASAIVGLKVDIIRLEGKQKLGQNRSSEDQKGVYSALSESERLDDLALSKYMQKHNIGIGG